MDITKTDTKIADEALAPSENLDDPLLDCLVMLTGHHGVPRSADVLIAGLPFDGSRISPQLFVRAAERAGFRSRVVKRSLTHISRLVLPCVLVLKGTQACLLMEMEDHDTAVVAFPETGGGAEKVTIEDLERQYSGYAIFVRPEFRFADREEGGLAKPRSWFWGTIAANWWIYLQVGLAAVLINVFALILPMFNMQVYDRVVPNNAIDTLWVLSFGVFTVLGFDFIIKTLRTYFIDTAGKKADVILACRLFDQVLDMRLAGRPGSAGAFANTLREFETLRDFFTSATLTTLVDLPFIVIFIAVIWLISGPVALLLALAIPGILLYGFLIQFPLNHVVMLNFRESQERHGILVETLNGLEIIKSIGAEGRMRRLWENSVGMSARSSHKARGLAMSAVNFAALLQQLTTIGVMIYGVHLVAKGELTMGGLVACSMLGGRATAPLGQLAQLLTRLNQSMASLKALNAIMEAPVERPADKTFLHRPRLSGAISFKGVHFTYPGRKKEVLTGLDFAISAGEHVGFIGRVGSGKSTIAKLMINLYEPIDGTILVDGTDIHQVDPVDLRRDFGYVPQDSFLFRGTVRDNITAAAPHADDAAILWAARLSGVDDFLNQDPIGYDLPVGERGDGLSGGQRQLVSVARAFMRNPGLVILDEPTSAIDTRTEEALVQRLKIHMKNQTLILITHRGSLLNLVDRVIVIDGGRVVADGPRTTVLDALAAGRIAAVRG